MMKCDIALHEVQAMNIALNMKYSHSITFLM